MRRLLCVITVCIMIYPFVQVVQITTGLDWETTKKQVLQAALC